MPRVYLAGPPYADEYRRRADALLRELDCEPVDPMRRDFRGRTAGHERELVEGDLAEIGSCDAVLASFTAPDEGTAMEAWYARSRGIAVVAYTGGTPPHPWAVYVAASVHDTLEAAAAAVAAVAATTPPPPADDVRRLLELRAIEQLKARYFRLLDTRDWDAFRGLFTADARFESPGTQGGSVGVDRFLEIVRQGWITKGSMHHGHTPELELTGPDTARGTWWMQTVHRPIDPAERRSRVIHGYGYYDEDYRRIDGEWRIARLRLTLLREDALAGETIREAYADAP